VNDVSAARWLGTILAAATIAVYAQVVHHDFVNWDDPEYVVQNPVVSKGLSLEAWRGRSAIATARPGIR